MKNYWIKRKYSRLVRRLREWDLAEVLPDLRRAFPDHNDWDKVEEALGYGAVITNFEFHTEAHFVGLRVFVARFEDLLDNLNLEVVVDLKLDDDGRLRVGRAPFKVCDKEVA